MSFELKEKGNAAFKQGDYNAAEEFYSLAIQKNPTEPTFFTNRALTRIKLEQWAPVEQDARAAMRLYGGTKNPSSLKSAYYLSQALVGQHRPKEAYEVAVDAYRASLAGRNAQSENLSRMVLRAKQMIWAAGETERLRGLEETLGVCERVLEEEFGRVVAELRGRLERGEIGGVGFGEDERALREEWEKNVRNLREMVRVSSGGKVEERVVPDYLIDGITFEIMHDPVVTKAGNSFERLSIERYVREAGVDPITREKMTVDDLRPNYALKAACEEFLDRNGWAVDW